MDLSDLRCFITASRHPSLQSAADELHLTPSALSKAIKRLEESLGAPLFDRSGKSLRLNAAGELLRQRGLSVLQLVEETRSEFEGADFKVRCRIAGPAVLQWRFGTMLARLLRERHADSSVVLRPAFEDDALAALLRGEVDFALITQEALKEADRQARIVEAVPLGEVEMQLAASPNHPLVAGRGRRRTVSTAEVLAHDFVSPARSLFCGIPRGSSSDGWRDDQLPRHIRYWVDDLQALLAFVSAGQALAYLPAFALRAAGLVQLQVSDCPYRCTESAMLAWRPSVAAGWQAWLAHRMRTVTG